MSDFLKCVSVRLKEDAPIMGGEPITTPEAAVRTLARELKSYDREALCVINLSVDKTPINMNIVSIGTLDYAVVHSRDVFKSAILSNASSIILVHNHQSGLKPSASDIETTDRIKKAGELLGIPLLDHVITNRTGAFYSILGNVNGAVSDDLGMVAEN